MIKKIEDDNKYIFHYTSYNVLMDHILKTKKIRFGKMKDTNDPKESIGPIFAYGCCNEEGDYSEAIREVRLELNKYKTVSFCKDGKERFKRGYHKARMWAQYGDDHKGCCLIINREKFERSIYKGFYESEIYIKDITYSNHKETLTLTHLDDLNKEVKRFVHQFNDYLLFHKTEDWSGETERRYIVYSENEYEYLSIEDSLEGLVFGHKFNNDDREYVLKNIPNIESTRITWLNGHPSYGCVYENYSDYIKEKIKDRIYNFVRIFRKEPTTESLIDFVQNISIEDFKNLQNRLVDIHELLENGKTDIETLNNEIKKILPE